MKDFIIQCQLCLVRELLSEEKLLSTILHKTFGEFFTF